MTDDPRPSMPPSNPWTLAVGVAGIVLLLGGLFLFALLGPDGGTGLVMAATAVPCWLAAIVIEGVGWHLRHPR